MFLPHYPRPTFCRIRVWSWVCLIVKKNVIVKNACPCIFQELILIEFEVTVMHFSFHIFSFFLKFFPHLMWEMDRKLTFTNTDNRPLVYQPTRERETENPQPIFSIPYCSRIRNFSLRSYFNVLAILCFAGYNVGKHMSLLNSLVVYVFGYDSSG